MRETSFFKPNMFVQLTHFGINRFSNSDLLTGPFSLKAFGALCDCTGSTMVSSRTVLLMNNTNFLLGKYPGDGQKYFKRPSPLKESLQFGFSL